MNGVLFPPMEAGRVWHGRSRSMGRPMPLKSIPAYGDSTCAPVSVLQIDVADLIRARPRFGQRMDDDLGTLPVVSPQEHRKDRNGRRALRTGVQEVEERTDGKTGFHGQSVIDDRGLERRTQQHARIRIAEEFLANAEFGAFGILEHVIEPRQVIPVQRALHVIVLLDHRKPRRIADVGIARPAETSLQQLLLKGHDNGLAQGARVERPFARGLQLEATRMQCHIRHGRKKTDEEHVPIGLPMRINDRCNIIAQFRRKVVARIPHRGRKEVLQPQFCGRMEFPCLRDSRIRHVGQCLSCAFHRGDRLACMKKERTVLMHSWEALPQAYSEYMKRQCAQNERTITYMPFRV